MKMLQGDLGFNPSGRGAEPDILNQKPYTLSSKLSRKASTLYKPLSLHTAMRPHLCHSFSMYVFI